MSKLDDLYRIASEANRAVGQAIEVHGLDSLQHHDALLKRHETFEAWRKEKARQDKQAKEAA